MLHQIKKIFRSKLFLLVFTLFVSSQISYAQSGIGSSLPGITPAPNSQHDYFYDSGLIIFKAKWAVTGGTIVSSVRSGTVYTVTVLWGGAGSGTVTFKQGNIPLASANYTIAYPVPDVPSAPTITQNCGNTVLTRGGPPSGITWYWQSSSTGTSTSNSSSSVTRTTGTVYYLRARDNASAIWSAARTVNYTVKVVPNTPTAPTTANNCGNTVLTRVSPPSGEVWYWQSSASGTSTSNSSSSITRTSGTVYYLRAKNTASGCWSTARTVNYSINTIPSTPSVPTVAQNCGNTVLTRGNTPPSGVTFYWQSSSSGVSTSNSNSSITRTSGTVYYLRPRNNSSLCWGTAVSVGYSIDAVPSIPTTPTITNFCSSTKLTHVTPPSGITWYWQSSSSGTSTSNGSNSITLTSGTVYYLRARNNSSGCWSSAETVNYTVDALPAVPSSPTETNNCGNTVLTKGTAPSGVTWYWQSSATGTSTADASNTKSFTTGSVYYLRARINSSGCWGTARTINYNVNLVPATPTTPSVANNCGNSILTRIAPPSGITWYWQSSSSGTSTADSNTTKSLTSGSVYYLRARNNSSSCWGTSVSVNYSISPIPTWYADTDGDGYGNVGSSTTNCSQPAGYVSNSSDFDDTTANITNIAPQNYYSDSDGDGFGDPNISVYYSVQPSGYVTNNTDNCPNEHGTNNGCDYLAPTFSNENYVFTRNYQTAMSSPSGITKNSDVLESISYFDGLGRAMQTRAKLAGGDQTHNNLIDWRNDWSLGSGSTAMFNKNGAISENERIYANGPHGDPVQMWECINDSASNGDGGWNTDYIAVDNTQTYRYTVWVKRTGSVDGHSYHGTQNVNNLDGTANGNPYFWVGDPPQLDQWYLLVGVIHPSDYSGGYSGVTGVYDTTGVKVLNGTEFKWDSTSTTSRFRSYLYYATDTSVRQYFYNPTVQQVNGAEMSLEDIIAERYKNDIITPVVYDDYGRQHKQYLPQAENTSNDLLFKDPAAVLSEIDDYYTANFADDINSGTPNPFSESAYESSPLSRVMEQAAPGQDWALGTTISAEGHSDGHTIKFGYSTNVLNEVKRFSVNLTETSNGANKNYSPALVGDNTYYAINQLYKTVTKDENWSDTQSANLLKNHTTEEFKDKNGKVVLKRTYADIGGVAEAHDTYYVYDTYGNLSYVLPPKMDATTNLLTTINGMLDDLAYQYVYDFRNRLIEKKIPGKGWEFIVYDELDRPVLTQDAVQRPNKEWLFTKYDELGRVAYTGQYIHSPEVASQNTMQQYFDTQNTTTLSRYETKVSSGSGYSGSYYNNTNFPSASITLHAVNYYDNYDFDLAGSDLPQNLPMVYGKSLTTNVTGLATASRVLVLTTGQWITSISYYDDKARPIYVYSKNDYLNTIDNVKTDIDFAGKVLQTESSHAINSGTPIVVIDDFVYDETGRLKTQNQTIGAQTEVIVSNSYDRLGQLSSKKVGNTVVNPLQTVDYNYNIRGWLTQINNANTLGSDLFGFELNYNTVSHGGTALYNGNIAETEWKTANDNVQRWYNYQYDALNRITTANDNDGHYNVYDINYDKNGNILGLKRDGKNHATNNTYGAIDVLTYGYETNSNKLKDVNDTAIESIGFTELANSSTEYTYDQNGNMLTDDNKGITGIIYNHLNLPTQVSINGSGGNGTISYIYDASGAKLAKVMTEGSSVTTTKYAGNYIYTNTGSGDALQFFNHPEGYVEPDGSGFDYIYQYKDHLGNIRLSYKDTNGDGVITAASEIQEENNYYPFGLKHKGYGGLFSGADHKYGFGGMEEQSELGLEWLDFSARNYNPELGRWMNLDPLAEDMRRHSPYNYAFDNPIFFVDPDGMKPFSGGKDYVLSSSQRGNVSPVRTNSYWNPSRKRGKNGLNYHHHSLPSSGQSTTGTKTVLSGNIIKPSFAAKLVTKMSAKELTNSISSEVTTVTGQYLDNEGNKLDSIDGASSYSVNTSTETTTFEPGYTGELPEEGTRTSSSSTTTYDISDGSGMTDYGGKQLTNAKTTSTEASISTINFEDASQQQQETVKTHVASNFKAAAKIALKTLQNLEKAIPVPEAKDPDKY